MFNFLTDSIENGLGILGGLISGEMPSKRQVAKLLADGVSVYAIAEATGFAVDVIRELAGDNGGCG